MREANIPIVVVTYNREKSLKRLLDSLSNAYYDDEIVELIISIDKSNNTEIYKMAEDFNWSYGKKSIIKYQSNLGLRNHILKCGDLTATYDAIVVLEDDLIVSKSFYRFAKQSYKFYKDEENVAGISLYSYRINEFSDLRSFIPLQDDSDVFFAMVPSSWGQMWTRNHWVGFKSWYDNRILDLNQYRGLVPDVVLNWKESSWKKYFHIYLAEKKKSFVYPRIAHSTNMGDKGTNNVVNSSSHQAILMGDFRRDFIFKKISDSTSVRYDAFFENVNILEKLIKYGDEIIVDYYGTKNKYGKSGYILSIEKLNKKIVAHWGLELVPYEQNVENEIIGNRIFLYDLSQPNRFDKKYEFIPLIKYENPSLTKRKALRLCINEYMEAIFRKIGL